MEMTHIFVAEDLRRSRNRYGDVLGAPLTGECGGTSAVFNFQGAWLLIFTPGGETPDSKRAPRAMPPVTGVRAPGMVRPTARRARPARTTRLARSEDWGCAGSAAIPAICHRPAVLALHPTLVVTRIMSASSQRSVASPGLMGYLSSRIASSSTSKRGWRAHRDGDR